MTRGMAKLLQDDLLDVFQSYEPELHVSVGITRGGGRGGYGVTIRSQDPDVDAKNIGKVVAQ